MMIFKLKSNLFIYRFLGPDRKKNRLVHILILRSRDRVYIMWGGMEYRCSQNRLHEKEWLVLGTNLLL